MLFDIDIGGLNNIRIGWENAGLIAYHTGRTLVLPQAMPYYLIDAGPGVDYRGSVSLMEDFINLPQLQRGLRVMTFGEFAAKEFPEYQLISPTHENFVEFAKSHAKTVETTSSWIATA
jgi:hypothetical protein